jgi:hypothetical protein
MSLMTSRAVVTAAIETIYNTDPGSGYTGILCNKGLSIKANADKVERDIIRQTFSPMGHVIGAKSYEVSIETELKGGGVLTGTPVEPEISTLLQACGYEKTDAAIVPVTASTGTWQIGETVQKAGTPNTDIGTLADMVITAGVGTLYIRSYIGALLAADSLVGKTSAATATVGAAGVTKSLCYRPISDPAAMKSITLQFWRDGIRHVATGVRGDVEFDFNVGKYPTAKFTLQGSYYDPADITLPNPTFSSIIPAICVNAGLQIGNIDMSKTCATALSFKTGNDVKARDCINAPEGRMGFDITARKPTGSVDPEATALADFNPWAAWKAASSAAIFATIGSDAGNRIRVSAPYAVYDDVSYGDRNGLVTYTLPFTCKGVAGDDEFSLMFF